MDSKEINLSSLSNKENSKSREQDDYILSKVNITREELEKIDDEKYQKILEVIEEKLKEREAEKIKKQEEEKNEKEIKEEAELNKEKNENTWNKPLINTDTLISKNNKKKEEEQKEKKAELKAEEEKKEAEEEEKIETSELFSNYKSDFKKEENQFFKKLREKRQRIKERLRMPKTRVSLVIWLILLTIATISTLFTVDPEHHSFKAYKTNILQVKNKYFWNNQKKIKENTNIYNNLTKEQSEKLNTLTGSALEEYKQEIIREALKNKYQQ